MSEMAQAWMERQKRLGEIGDLAASCMSCHKRIRIKGQRKKYDWCRCSNEVITIADVLMAHGLESLGAENFEVGKIRRRSD